MSPYRGSDDQLDREIATVRGLVRVRLRRANDDLRELEVALDELRRERRRRQQLAVPSGTSDAASPVPS